MIEPISVTKVSNSETYLDYKIYTHMLVDGEGCYEVMEAIAIHLACIAQASELDRKIGFGDYRLEALRGGISACQQTIFTDSWVCTNLPAITKALEFAEELAKEVCQIALKSTVDTVKSY